MMDTFAVRDNLFTYQNGLLYDIAGRPRSPYFLRRIQLVAPLADSINASTIKLKYLPQLFRTNLSLAISGIVITGLTQSAINLPLDGSTVDVSGISPGYKTMQIQVNYTNGQQFTRTAGLNVVGTNNLAGPMNALAGPPPNDSFWFSSTIPFQGYDEPAAYCGKNEITVYSRGADNTLKPIMKPIIILDGFDPTDKRNGRDIYLEAFKYIDPNNQQLNYADELKVDGPSGDNGFDLIIVNHPKYNDAIRTRNDPANQLPYYNTVGPFGIRLSTVRGGGDYIQRNAWF